MTRSEEGRTFLGVHARDDRDDLEPHLAEEVVPADVAAPPIGVEVHDPVVLHRDTGRRLQEVGRAQVTAVEVEDGVVRQHRRQLTERRPLEEHVRLPWGPAVLAHQACGLSQLLYAGPRSARCGVGEQLVGRDEVVVRAHAGDPHGGSQRGSTAYFVGDCSDGAQAAHAVDELDLCRGERLTRQDQAGLRSAVEGADRDGNRHRCAPLRPVEPARTPPRHRRPAADRAWMARDHRRRLDDALLGRRPVDVDRDVQACEAPTPAPASRPDRRARAWPGLDAARYDEVRPAHLDRRAQPLERVLASSSPLPHGASVPRGHRGLHLPSTGRLRGPGPATSPPTARSP